MASSFESLMSLWGNDVSVRWLITLLHFLWQGAVVGGLVMIAGRSLQRSSAQTRYAAYSIALLSLPICVAVTFCRVNVPESLRSSTERESTPDVSVAPSPAVAAKAMDVPVPAPRASNSAVVNAAGDDHWNALSRSLLAMLSCAAPWIAGAYVVGVACFLLRLSSALWGGRRLRTRAIRVTDEILLRLIAEQANRVKLKCAPVVAYCERIAVPTVLGVLHPIILLPTTLMTGLPPDDLAAILHHELAHIRRYDLWMNLLQRVIESLLFFHPVVWLISRRLNAEREECCDDLVVSSGYEPLHYAGALLRMAELCALSRRPSALVLAATGNNTPRFEKRVERLINWSNTPRLQLTRAGIGGLLLALISLIVVPGIAYTWSQAQAQDASRPAVKEENDRGDILWGKEVDGLRLGIRPAPTEKSGKQFRYGDWLRYEVWIKNETDQAIHVPRDPASDYGPALLNKAVNVVGFGSRSSWHVPLEELDKAVLTLRPQQAALLLLFQSSQAPVLPVGAQRERFGPEPLRIAPGAYPCFAELDLYYFKDGFYHQGRQDGRNVHLQSEFTVIQILPAARLQGREAEEVTPASPDQTVPFESPQLLYSTWQNDGIHSTGKPIPHILWDLDGKILDDQLNNKVLKKVGSFSVHWRKEDELHPLGLVFQVDQRITHCPVMPTVIMTDGKKSSGGTARSKPTNGMNVSAAVPRTDALKEWPKDISLEIKYPVDNITTIKTLTEVPDDPVTIAPGVQWYLDPTRALAREAGGLRRAEGKTAAVLQTSRDVADPLVSYNVQVFLRGKTTAISSAYGTIIEPGGKLHDIDVSEAFDDKNAIERVEITRQHYAIKRINKVPVRIDLLPKMENAK